MNKSKTLWLVALMGLVVCCGGCKSFRYEFTNRVLDMLDPIRLNVSYGPYAGAHVKVSSFVQAGGMFFKGDRLGMIGRNVGLWSERRTDFHLGMPIYSYMNVKNGEGSTFNEKKAHTQRVLIFDPDLDQCRYSDYRFAEVMASVHLFLGVEVGVDLWEFCDFFGGFFGTDLTDDDEHPEDAVKPEPLEKSPNKKPTAKSPKPEPLEKKTQEEEE